MTTTIKLQNKRNIYSFGKNEREFERYVVLLQHLRRKHSTLLSEHLLENKRDGLRRPQVFKNNLDE